MIFFCLMFLYIRKLRGETWNYFKCNQVPVCLMMYDFYPGSFCIDYNTTLIDSNIGFFPLSGGVTVVVIILWQTIYSKLCALPNAIQPEIQRLCGMYQTKNLLVAGRAPHRCTTLASSPKKYWKMYIKKIKLSWFLFLVPENNLPRGRIVGGINHLSLYF